LFTNRGEQTKILHVSRTDLDHVDIIDHHRDVLGVAAYQAIAGDRYRDHVDSDFTGEAGLEVYYRCQVLPWLAVTPDLQYLVDPGGARGTEDAVVALLRFRVTF